MSNLFSDYMTDEILIGEEEKPAVISTGLFSEEELNLQPPDDQEKKKPIKNIDPEYEKLKKQSANSVLLKHIQVEELNRLKIENERIQFLKSAGKVAEIKFMEFLYFGYMEKANLDLMKMVKKLKVRYEPLMTSDVLSEVIEILTKEINYVLTSIKKKQIEEVKNWKDGIQ